MRHTGFLRGLSDAASDLVDDDVIVGGVAAKQASDADDGVVFFCLGESAGGGGDFEGSGDADDINVFLAGAQAKESVACALQQALSNERVKAGYDEREPLSPRVELAFEGRVRGSRWGLEFEFVFR